jgi:hypothetical protein
VEPGYSRRAISSHACQLYRFVVKFYEALKSSRQKPEVHIFSAGGHGFGMRKRGTSSDHWIDEFYYWSEARR